MTDEVTLEAKLHAETATISWAELQRFYAQGAVLQIATELDLIKVAVWFAEDCTQRLEPLFVSGAIAQPSNETARNWYATKASLWSVVVAPYVLVQEPKGVVEPSA